MKKIILLALGLGFLNTSFAQGEYWGVTREGGVGGAGSVYKIDEDASNPTIVHSFAFEVPGADPDEAKLVELNGLLYGTTEGGGFEGQGTLYSYNPSTGEAISLVFFNENVNGQFPISAVRAQNGKIYGLTSDGGPNDGAGTIFEYDPVADTIVVITVFDGLEFTGEECRITFAADGTLYVISQEGGVEGDGLFFEVDINTGQTQILHEFVNSDPAKEGRRPNGELVEFSPGVFYGTTRFGGTDNDGVLYKFDTNTGIYTKLVDFSENTTGESSYSGLLLASNQKMYGTTEEGSGGSGLIYEFDPISETLSVLHVFTGNDGAFPQSGLVEASSGILYGLTEFGGVNDEGTLFEYNLNTSTFTKKVDFEQGTVGFRPNGEFWQASDGKLYATLSSGAISSGTVFAYTPGATDIQVVVEFETAIEGSEPTDQLCLGQNGKVYGFTTDGGAADRGVLFEIDPATGQYTVLHDFVNLADGRTLEGPLATIGNVIYGVASNGGDSTGATSVGTLFSYDLDSDVFTVEHLFEDATGRNPGAGLIVTSQGTLVGTALNESAVTGNIFEFDPATGTFTVLFEFDITVTGSFVKAPLLEYQPGVFYGTLTNFNFNTDGAVFKYDRNTDTYTLIHEFMGGTLDGENPETPLLLAQDGLIYGTTNSGGIDGDGILFSIDPATDVFNVVLNFLEDPEPNSPSGGALVQAPNGKIYGSTPDSGPSSDGILYEIDLDQGTITGIILDFFLYNKVQGGFISVPDIYSPEAVCQDITVELNGSTGSYVANDLDGGSRDNSSTLLLGLWTDSLAVTTSANSNTDDFFDNGDTYFYEEGSLILEAPASVTFTDPNQFTGTANSILAIYETAPIPNSGLLDNRFGLVGYAIFDGSSVMVGPNNFSLNANQTYFFQLSTLSPNTTGDISMILNTPVISDLAEIFVDCDSGTQSVTLYAYDRSGNLDFCTANVSVSETEAPVATAGWDEVPNSGVLCGIWDFEVNSSGTDNCGDPSILNVVTLPALDNPTVLYKVRPTNALKIRLDQNAVKVFGPDPQGFWNQILADGGIAVEQGQTITFREGNVSSTPIVYNFNGANELSLVKNDNMTLVTTATDPSGNSNADTLGALIPCILAAITGEEQEASNLEALEQSVVQNDLVSSDLLSVFPNPSHGVTHITFDLNQTQEVWCQILDVSGRIIEVLHAGDLGEGPQQLLWRASEDLAAGIYFVQLQTEGDLQMQKIQITH